MADKIISVRMPDSLVEELKLLSEKNHYLDVSEEIRSLLREKWLDNSDPYSAPLREIRMRASAAAIPSHIDSLKEDLKRLLEEIENAKQ